VGGLIARPPKELGSSFHAAEKALVKDEVLDTLLADLLLLSATKQA
tara:strand:- start:2280 stop:2417 length:138 start_codon:yes stop_codon:yes gene_type:complete